MQILTFVSLSHIKHLHVSNIIRYPAFCSSILRCYVIKIFKNLNRWCSVYLTQNKNWICQNNCTRLSLFASVSLQGDKYKIRAYQNHEKVDHHDLHSQYRIYITNKNVNYIWMCRQVPLYIQCDTLYNCNNLLQII